MEKPDWVFWLSRPSVTLEECICLSLDAEPEIDVETQTNTVEQSDRETSKPNSDNQSGELQAAPVVVSAAFQTYLWLKRKKEKMAVHPAMQTPEARKRLAVLRKHFDAEINLLPPAVERHLVGGSELLHLADFARWAQLQKWSGPEELGLVPELVRAQEDKALREALAEAEGARAVLEAQLASMKAARTGAQQTSRPAIFNGMTLLHDLVSFTRAVRVIAAKTGVHCREAHEALDGACRRAGGVRVYLVGKGGAMDELGSAEGLDALDDAYNGQWWKEDRERHGWAAVRGARVDADQLHIPVDALRRMVPELATEIVGALQADGGDASLPGAIGPTLHTAAADMEHVRAAQEEQFPSVHTGSNGGDVDEKAVGLADCRVVIHSTKPERRDDLRPAIDEAQRRCRDQWDVAEVWNALRTLAEEEFPPLLGLINQQTIKHRGGTLSRKNFGDRLRRAKESVSARAKAR